MPDSSPLAHSPTLAATAPSDSERRLEAGVKAGEYIIERFIGAGAMGEVYAGRHPVIGKSVAIKVLRYDLAASAEASERFIREARAVNQVSHENVVDVFAFGRLDDGRLYLVMDLVEGRSLRAHLVNGPLEIAQALAIVDAIADALDAAHARGVVHRDLKPDNIVLSNATPPKVCVLDFGIAKLVSTASASDNGNPEGPGTLTGQGTWLGTPGYMAPEQWSVDGAGPASDRYALGVIAYELLSGALPFSASSVPAMMEQHFRAAVPPLSARGAVGVPSAVDKVLARALAKDPDARFPTARAFAAALRAAGGHRGQEAVAHSRARTAWMPAVAGAGVLGIGLVVILLPRDEPAPQARSTEDPVRHTASIQITSTPSAADVLRGGDLVGTTPLALPASAGERVEVVVRKPGYLAHRREVSVAHGAAINVQLHEVREFVGTWRLASGELRELRRSGDRVEVFKKTAVEGDATFFKHYDFISADRGVAFGADDELVDPRAPGDPRCHVKVHVEYRYDPATDALEQLRDKVKIGFHDGSCVVQSREVEPTRLVRVDRGRDEVELSAPVGRVAPTEDLPVSQADKALAPKALKQQKLEAEKNLAAERKAAERKPAPNNVGEKQTDAYTEPAKKRAGKQRGPAPQAPAPASTPDAQDGSQRALQKK